MISSIIEFFNNNNLINITSGLITAGSTLALAVLTWALVRATKAMAEASSSAHIVVSLDSNEWHFSYFDVIVHNTGNAAAFDVSVKFDPPLPHHEELLSNNRVPFSSISIIRPGQILSSGLNTYDEVSKNSYKVNIKWKKKPNSKRFESMCYTIDISGHGALSRRQDGTPAVQIASQLKLMRDDWRAIARGHGVRLKVDSYNARDRAQEHEEIMGMIEKQKSGNGDPKNTPE